MSKYRTTWSQIQEQMNEFALSHTVRYRDPLNKKRFAVPFKTAEKAKEKMDQLKSCLLYTSPSPRDRQKSRMPSSA